MLRKILRSFVIITLFSSSVEAQQNLGVATSNWSGMQGLYQNPANIADSREKICIDIFSVSAGVDNNLGYLNSKGGLISAINNGNTNNLFTYSNNSAFSLTAPYAQIHLPGIMVNLDHKNSIALTTSINGMNQFNNFNQSLFRTITDPNFTTNSDINLTSSKFNYTAQLWTQIGLTYGGVLIDQGCSELKVGVTLRYLGGVGYVGFKGNNLDAHYKAGIDSLYVTNSDLEFASNIVTTKSAILSGLTKNSVLSEFFGSKSGMGVSGDIGLVYDYIPACDRVAAGKKKDYSKNLYKIRLAASVMDIGSITYKASTNSNAEVTGNGYITGQGLSQNVSNYNDFRNYAVSHGFTADTSSKSTKLYMPTTLHISADYAVYGRLYVNAAYIGNLANKENFGNTYYNQVTVTPRYDTRVLSIGLPITYSMLTENFKMGIGVRAYGLFAGSDDMLALVADHQYGFNFYFGGYVPFNYKKKKAEIDSMYLSPEPDMEHGGSSDTTSFTPGKLNRLSPGMTLFNGAPVNKEEMDKPSALNEDADEKRANK